METEREKNDAERKDLVRQRAQRTHRRHGKAERNAIGTAPPHAKDSLTRRMDVCVYYFVREATEMYKIMANHEIGVFCFCFCFSFVGLLI